MKKYTLLDTDTKIIFGKKLFRIKALIDFDDVKKGELGGYVEDEKNLNHIDDAWVYGDAKVYDDAEVYGNAKVYSDAWVFGNADYATVKGFGSHYRHTTFMRCKDGSVKVACGCFLGTLDEFREQVKDTREGKIKDEYLKIANLMERHFTDEASNEERTSK